MHQHQTVFALDRFVEALHLNRKGHADLRVRLLEHIAIPYYISQQHVTDYFLAHLHQVVRRVATAHFHFATGHYDNELMQ